MGLKVNALNIGTAGIPGSSKKPGTAEGVKRERELGLSAMELEFVHSINISAEKAPEVRKAGEENSIVLSCHAPYYINLNAKEKPKWHASIGRIVQSAKIASLCGGYSVCFHPGYYMKDQPGKVYAKMKESMTKIMEELKDAKVNDVWVRPETAGRVTQFGSLKELFELCRELQDYNVLPCIDWSHIHATSNGKYNTRKEFEDVLSSMEKSLGKKALQNVHFHCQGVNYTEKGERNHIMLDDSDLNYRELVAVWKEWKLKGVVVAESPVPEKDALILKKVYDEMAL